MLHCIEQFPLWRKFDADLMGQFDRCDTRNSNHCLQSGWSCGFARREWWIREDCLTNSFLMMVCKCTCLRWRTKEIDMSPGQSAKKLRTGTVSSRLDPICFEKDEKSKYFDILWTFIKIASPLLQSRAPYAPKSDALKLGKSRVFVPTW